MSRRQSSERGFVAFIFQRLSGTVVKAAVAVAVVAALSWAFGSLIDMRLAFWAFIALVALSVISDQVGEFSPEFGLSFIAVLLLLSMFLPEWFVSAFDPLIDIGAQLTGIQLRAIDPAAFAVLAGVAIVVMWVVDIRFTSAFRTSANRPLAVRPSTVISKVQTRKAEPFTREWAGVFVAIAAFVIAVVGIILNAGTDVGAEAVDLIAQAPVVAAAVLTDIIGYVSLGGSIVLFGTDVGGLVPRLSASEFAIVAGVIVVFAVAARRRMR